MEFMAAFKGVGNLAMALAGKFWRALPPWIATVLKAEAAALYKKLINYNF